MLNMLALLVQAGGMTGDVGGGLAAIGAASSCLEPAWALAGSAET